MGRRHRTTTKRRPKPPEVALLDAVARRFEADLARLEGTFPWRDWTAADRLARMKTTRQPEYVERRLTAHRWLDLLSRYEPLTEWPAPGDTDEERKTDLARQTLVLRRETYARGSASPAHSAARETCVRIVRECDAKLAGGLLGYAGELDADDGAALEVGTIEWSSDMRTLGQSRNARRALFGVL
jgi:hypothetical protein